MPSFEIKGGGKKKPSSGTSLPNTGGTIKVLPRGHGYKPGSIPVKLAYKMKKGFA